MSFWFSVVLYFVYTNATSMKVICEQYLSGLEVYRVECVMYPQSLCKLTMYFLMCILLEMQVHDRLTGEFSSVWACQGSVLLVAV